MCCVLGKATCSCKTASPAILQTVFVRGNTRGQWGETVVVVHVYKGILVGLHVLLSYTHAAFSKLQACCRGSTNDERISVIYSNTLFGVTTTMLARTASLRGPNETSGTANGRC